MSTSKTYQQSLADAGSETKPPMLERGNYIPWASRFRRYKNRKRENRKWLNKALDEGPYKFEMFIPNNSTVLKLQTAEDLQGDRLLHYDAEMELMNLIFLSIPSDIYNSFVAEPEEALVSVYNRFAQLMNDLERNDMHFPIVTINTKFLNSLQPEWLKYVTQFHLAKCLTVDTFDDLLDYLQQFEKLVNVSRAEKLEKSHDPLALVAHTGSSSRNTSSYYVIHHTSVVDYEDEYQQDDVHTNFEDPLASAMLLVARSITQKFSTPTNNCLRTSSNTRNQAIIQGDMVNIKSRNSCNFGRNNRRAYIQEEIVEGLNAPNETGNVQSQEFGTQNTSWNKILHGQMLLGEMFKDSSTSLCDASRMKKLRINCNMLKARIQPADNTSDVGPSYDSAFINNSLHAEIEQLKKKSIEIQEGLQARIKILEKDVQRFSKESTLSKSLDTTYVVSKPKIDVGSTSKANDKVVQIVLWIVDSGCSKHMTGDRSLLKNFIEKFMGTVRFRNDNFAAITGYGDYIQGNITICHVYYVEGLGHNLFSVGQFCDGDLEVAFRSKTCYSGA
ncbi:hypothetical protein Tco_0012805 [Tanacetum coccineum]